MYGLLGLLGQHYGTRSAGGSICYGVGGVSDIP